MFWLALYEAWLDALMEPFIDAYWQAEYNRAVRGL